MKLILLLLSALIVLPAGKSLAQDTTISLAFKNNKPERRTKYFYQPDLSYQLWQQFNLIKEANTGNANAQHELGIRYFLGDGMKADTMQGAFWIKKAADQNLTAAAFNYGILLINGWGVEWNPFLAFRYFMQAANGGMPQAQHLIGILYTDNLLVKRDWNTAYAWIKKSYDQGFQPAKTTLERIADKVDPSNIDTNIVNKSFNKSFNKSGTGTAENNDESLSSSIGLVFIDFDSISDSTREIEVTDLLEDLTLLEDEKISKMLYKKTGEKDSVLSMENLDNSFLLKLAESGSPEALTLLGKFYEEGKFYKKNLITSAAYYLRAIRLDSPRAPVLLYDMLRSNNITGELKKYVEKDDAEAMFVWHGLNSLNFDNSITAGDALNLLQKSASFYYLPAVVELGLMFYTGKIKPEDQQKGLSLWKEAERSGSKEASVRIETSIIFSLKNNSQARSAYSALQQAEKDGSLLAQVSLAHCYETGIGTDRNLAEAVKYYRLAARRGSQYAYKELQRLYDSIRPKDQMFNLN